MYGHAGPGATWLDELEGLRDDVDYLNSKWEFKIEKQALNASEIHMIMKVITRQQLLAEPEVISNFRITNS